MILPLRICNWWRAPSLIESRSKQWCDILILMCVAVMTILMYYLISCRLPEAAIEMMLVLLLSSSDAAAVDDVCSLPLLGTITRCFFSHVTCMLLTSRFVSAHCYAQAQAASTATVELILCTSSFRLCYSKYGSLRRWSTLYYNE
jgi:hypothetical protein